MNSNNGFKLSGVTLKKAWEQFVITGSLQPQTVRPEIAESWHRCYKANVDPYSKISNLILNKYQLKQLRIRHMHLVEIAKPFMDRLYEFIAGSRLVVFLSNELGVIIECIGDYDIADSASKVNLVAGTNWTEEAVGTNGIGTVLKLKVPIQISGEEHYCAKLHHWTCSAAPIFNDTGTVIGVLQVSGPSSEVHLHTLGMIVAAVEAIKDQIRIKNKNYELNVLNNSLNNIFHTMSDGAIIINKEGRIIQVNPPATQILGADIKGKYVREILGKSPKILEKLEKEKEHKEMEMMVETTKGRCHCLVTTKPLKDGDGNSNGAVLFLNQINNIKKLVNRFSGSQASFNFTDIIGSSSKLQDAIRIAKGAASSTSNILISGESGTGKELFAQAIHNQSPRQNGPFIALNCAALPRELISSELFGYNEGAFTGARRGGRPGKFEMADGGTLFLDEIGDMPIDQQAILLRVLQDKKITRIGGDHTIPVNVRFVCATNKNLQKEVHKENFRADLYYRLNVIHVRVPPLRDRMEDLIDLFNYLLKKICTRLDRHIDCVPDNLLQQLMKYEWPGNIRELENVVEKLVSTGHGTTSLCVEHLPARITQIQEETFSSASPICSAQIPCPKGMSGLLIEKEALIKSLDIHSGNISKVAKAMHLSRNTVYRKMSFYNISKQQFFK
ncbi:sigma-54-dependent Fis family transcriptional regulator [Desulfovibrio gilichinskyi]|uniref:PAS domain S-box-containing protein n=1 Tax=Desulfovibrio gilichinskyi TaxID=1519643 RepID=A0A1X7EL62_9BACT|nr:sigma-54-dependent Fis family transcriptional regulator [Desulfovibrio gilichinskyi]SMF35808.1 PAS domain S-box-containing protein [Desulfovibrio gilichinskyi]